MGIVTLPTGQQFVIASDCNPHETPTRRAPKRSASPHHVWTGKAWSAVMSEAQQFATEDLAEEYLRSHYAQVTGQR